MQQQRVSDAARLKRHALQIAAQLPDDRAEALRVLEYAREIVEWEAEQLPETVRQLRLAPSLG